MYHATLAFWPAYRVNFSTTPKTLPVLVNLQISTNHSQFPTPSPLQSCLTTTPQLDILCIEVVLWPIYMYQNIIDQFFNPFVSKYTLQALPTACYSHSSPYPFSFTPISFSLLVVICSHFFLDKAGHVQP